MAALRHSPLARRWLLLLAVVALVARGLVPAGWMPVATAQGATLGLCDGGGPMSPAMTHAMATPAHGGTPMEHHQGAPDHQCAFAAAAAAFAMAASLAPDAPPPVRARPVPVRAMTAIGHGLAAPPPPPTGPPAFA